MFLNESEPKEAIPVYGVEELSLEQALRLLDAEQTGLKDLRTDDDRASCPSSGVSRRLHDAA